MKKTNKTTSASGPDIKRLLCDEVAGRGVSRRDFFKGTGVLLMSCTMAGVVEVMNPKLASADFSSLVDPSKVGSWLAIAKDGSVTVFHGKVDNGQGVSTAFRQLVADELDVSIDRVRCVVGDTALTVDQVGASGSTGLKRGSPPVRIACAEARMVLLEMASRELGAPVKELGVQDGVVSVLSNAAKKVSYGELIGGRNFSGTLEWNKEVGGSLAVKGKAKLKNPDTFTVVGKPIRREDIPPIVFGRDHYTVDMRLPGMLHARSIKPPVAGAKLVKFDESSLAGIPGVVKVVARGDYLGVVCEREEHAIKAARQLKATWSEPSEPAFPTDWEGLHEYLRRAPTRLDKIAKNEGNVDEALKGAARVVEATYETPFQSHASFGPGCAVAQWQNGEMTVWTGTQKPYRQRTGLAKFLGLPPEKVRVIWKPGPGSYGRNDAGDVAFEAAFLAREVGRPVRLQWMRNDGIAWDPKSPPSVIRLRGGFDAAGNVIAYDWDNRSLDHQDVAPGEEAPGETLIGQFTGAKPVTTRNRIGTPDEAYGFPNKRWNLHAVQPFIPAGSPLRTTHLRLPTGSVVTFAAESFIDELAAAAGADPVQFRLRYLTDKEQIHLVRAAAEAAGWETRPSPRPGARAKGGGIVKGRGIALRIDAAVVAEVEVNLETGKVYVTRFVASHACGLIVNPDGLKNVIEGNLLHTMSRTLYEEVKFSRSKVTSTDWGNYPIATMLDAPDKIEKVLLNEPHRAPGGAGEETSAQVQPAIANAIFDATGVRIRRFPFTPERVKAALQAT